MNPPRTQTPSTPATDRAARAGLKPAAPPPTTIPVPPDAAAGAFDQTPPSGLTGDEAARRLAASGPNAMPDTALHPLSRALGKLWAPVPWMLEAAIMLELVLGKYAEAAIIAGLLVFNAALGFFQEGRAQATLAALKSRLALNASVRRDSAWKTVPAALVTPPHQITAAPQLPALSRAFWPPWLSGRT